MDHRLFRRPIRSGGALNRIVFCWLSVLASDMDYTI